MKPLATENVLINGWRIAYGVYGTQSDTYPVVLIHGTPSSSLIWRNVLPGLVSAGHHVYVFDLLGYGLSERPEDPSVDTSISGQVPILEGLLAFWRIDSFHLIAHDIGGGIAQRFSIFSPHRVRSLALIDVVSFDSYPSRRTKEQMEMGLERLINVEDKQHRAHFREWLLSAVLDQQSLAESSLDVYLDYISGPVGQASLFQHQVKHYDPKHTLEISHRYHELGKLPVKIIWGANDTWQVLDWAHKLNLAIPGSSLEVIDHCGHFSPEDKPEQITAILTAFLK
ncbi:Alpha/Beta hydrolase protein [Talaromyces proteolyticus]|uniref:Alpha/Beta hydrolase protein n=1 Tax=Talaromyces proteolyticus TaxID=1131652 RepID=A0AAD4KK53_9EURO|nr:Alpha/Beta hydrolase protein [Talaromyces proteolyticus]KAH8690301.1 Alpha/Beta hydrolase protein [Talaromyces proteolyticus]